MSTHTDHDHAHATGCGHPALSHGDHTDYLHDGHLHHPAGDGVEEHAIDVDDDHPDACGGGHECSGHEPAHAHGDDCGHPAVPHGEQTDYLVDGHLHHPHEGHCDDHGAVAA